MYTIHYEIGHTLQEWEEKFGGNPDLWDFPVIELFDQSVEPDEGMLYWFIDGRLYETD